MRNPVVKLRSSRGLTLIRKRKQRENYVLLWIISKIYCHLLSVPGACLLGNHQYRRWRRGGGDQYKLSLIGTAGKSKISLLFIVQGMESAASHQQCNTAVPQEYVYKMSNLTPSQAWWETRGEIPRLSLLFLLALLRLLPLTKPWPEFVHCCSCRASQVMRQIKTNDTAIKITSLDCFFYDGLLHMIYFKKMFKQTQISQQQSKSDFFFWICCWISRKRRSYCNGISKIESGVRHRTAFKSLGNCPLHLTAS